MTGLSKRALLHQLEGLNQLDLIDLEVGIRPRYGHGRAETFDQLARDADHGLPGDGVAHILGLRHRPVAAVDDPLDIRWDPRLHVRVLLSLA